MLGGDGKENGQKKSVGLKACYTRRFATTIFGAAKRSNIVAT